MKILIIEDEEKLAKALKEGLKQEGYSADYVLDGEKGQRRIEMYHNDYDLVLLDLMLPLRDGLTILRNIREEKITIPVLILTAKDTKDDIVLGLESGADDYLVKPFSSKELFARIKALLRRPKKSLLAEIKIQDLTLNQNTKKVFRKNREIPLTLKEFNLLELLMKSPDKVISREQILFNLWGFEFESFSNIVDAHIKNLRRKIGSNRSQKILETVRGIGYRLNS